MEERIIKMFNSISASDYYISNPYSSTCNRTFKKIFKSEDFLKLFYLLSNMTYERLAMIANVSEDSTKNTIFITGFRGCGKTCFLNLLDSMINSKYELPDYTDCKFAEKKLMYQITWDKHNEEMERIEKKYKKSSKQISDTIHTQMLIHSMEDSEQNYAKYLNSSLKGKSIFLNFEKGNASNDEFPFDKKFILKIEDVIEDIIKINSEKNNNSIFASIVNLYRNHTKCFNNTFEHQNSFFSFIEFCEKKLLSARNMCEVKVELGKILESLNLEQLLCILVLLHSSLQLVRQKEKSEITKVFFILDNMDIVYKHNILEKSMHEYSNFVENMNSLMDELGEKGEVRWSNLYDNMTFIFAMRETTAMQVADHFIDGMEFVARHFDISMDTDKSLVVEKKYRYIKKYETRIENRSLKKTLLRVHDICTDPYIKCNVFPMFNNDYKRAITCITSICEKNRDLMEQEIKLGNTNVDYNKNGARGIIFRVIFDEFMRKKYFEKIGMEPPLKHDQDFTISRPILTLLYNLLPEYDQEDFNDEDNARLTPETISLKYLYMLCKPIMNKKRFIDALVGMFSLKKAPTWNHLITFDNIKNVSYREIENYLNQIDSGTEGLETEIELRITCAGANYIKFICTHFEFFSCRYTKNTQPLFSYKNTLYSEKHGDYNFEYVIKNVYEAVVACCSALEKFNQKVIECQKSSGVSLLESDYIFRNKGDNIGKLHEERVIHWHIRYIDNYRMHLIKDIYRDKIEMMNEKIIVYIEQYVELLKNSLFSKTSEEMHEELMGCINYIKDKEYMDDTTQISRNSYKQLIKEGKISGKS